MPDSHIYDKTFFDYIAAGSTASARVVVPLITAHLRPTSLLDVGCGAGAWLSEYARAQVSDYLGIDGSYVQRESLLIPAENFRAQDISREFDLGRRFDLVQCLEVVEHLPPETSETLVQNLVRHGDRIIFSAAVPGQGGENHVNERSYEFWRSLFADSGYDVFDFLRPVIRNHSQVENWYRYNMLLYVRRQEVPALPAMVKRCRIPAGRPIPDFSPLTYRWRKLVLKQLPPDLLTTVAALKHRIHVRLLLRKGETRKGGK